MQSTLSDPLLLTESRVTNLLAPQEANDTGRSGLAFSDARNQDMGRRSEEDCDTPASSSGSGDTLPQCGPRKAGSRLVSRKATASSRGVSAESPSGETKAQAESGQGSNRRGTGGGVGLSTDELQALQASDPKRVKRILANRSSAARSKVRKLRYIGELESKAADLQEKANIMHAERCKLQADAQALSKENEELSAQACGLQDQLLVQDQETERLMQQVSQLQAMCEPILPLPAMSDHSVTALHPTESASSLHSPFALSRNLIYQGQSGEQQQQQQHSLRPLHRSLPPMPSLPPLASSASMFRSVSVRPAHACPPIDPSTAAGLERPQLFQRHHSDIYPASEFDASGSGVSCTTQESRLNAEMDHALLDLLRMTDLSPKQEPQQALQPFLPPLRVYGYGGSQYTIDEGSGMLGGLNSGRLHSGSFASMRFGPQDLSSSSQQSILPGLPPFPVHNSLPLPLGGRLRSVPSHNSSLGRSPDPSSSLFEHVNDGQAGREGLALWPRHFSDPQGFNRGQFR